MRAIGPDEMKELLPAEEAPFASPIPTQIVSSDEYLPVPQTAAQRQVEARLKELGASLAKRHGVSRRAFFQTAAGMAASYLVMNEVYGQLFSVSKAEAATAELADALRAQMIFDAHTHFIRDDAVPALADPKRAGGVMWQPVLTTKLGWNKDIAGKQATIEDPRFDNYFKEIYLDRAPKSRC